MNKTDSKKLPIVTGVIVAVNVIVYIICTFGSEMLYNKYGLTLDGVLRDKEVYRLLTSMFLHGDSTHIFNNMIVVFFLGSILEEKIGRIKYGTVYFVSGLCGNVLSLFLKYLRGINVMSIGASGALFGLDGALLALAIVDKDRIKDLSVPRIVLGVILSLYGGFTSTNIDNAAHVGGLVGGFLCTILLITFGGEHEH